LLLYPALQCLEACVAECTPQFRVCMCQKRIPDALATLVLGADEDLSTREKCLLLLSTWVATLPATSGSVNALILHEAAERLRLEGVPLDARDAGPFLAWVEQHAAREQHRLAADAQSPRSRRAAAALARASAEEADILPVDRDGRRRGRLGGDADHSRVHAGKQRRWNAAGRPLRRGAQGSDVFRTGTGTARGASDEEEDEDEDGDGDGDGQSDGAGNVWRTAPRTSAAHPRQHSRTSRSPPRPQGLSRGMSSDMADAAMMQEMLALDLKEEGETLLGEGDLHGALAVYTQALDYAPNYRLYLARAAVLLRLGRAEEAQADAVTLVTLLPSLPGAHALLGEAHEAQARHAQARGCYEKASFLANADGDDQAADDYAQAAQRCKYADATRLRHRRDYSAV